VLELLRRVNREGKFRLSKKELAEVAAASGGDETTALRMIEERGAVKRAGRKGKRTMKSKRKCVKKMRVKRTCRTRRAAKGRKAQLQFVGNVASIVLTRSTADAPRVIRQVGMKLYVPKNGGKSAVIRGLKSEK
jgi:hypothetical protein